MIRNLQNIAGILLWTLLTSSLQAEQPLAWKFVPGETSHYQLAQEMKTTISLGAPTAKQGRGVITTEVNQTLDMAWHVKEVREDETALVEISITRMQMKIDGPGGQGLAYDSASDERPQGFAAMLAGLMKSLTENTYQATITPRGEITGVVLPESLLEQVRNAPGGELMGGLTSEAGFKNLMSQNTLLLPEQAELAPGQQWTNTITIENPALGGKQTAETIYRYEGPQQVEGKQLEAFALQMVFNFESPKNPDGEEIQIHEQHSTGDMLFDRSAGRLNWSSLKIALELGIESEGQVIQQSIEQTIEMRLLETETDE